MPQGRHPRSRVKSHLLSLSPLLFTPPLTSRWLLSLAFCCPVLRLCSNPIPIAQFERVEEDNSRKEPIRSTQAPSSGGFYPTNLPRVAIPLRRRMRRGVSTGVMSQRENERNESKEWENNGEVSRVSSKGGTPRNAAAWTLESGRAARTPLPSRACSSSTSS